MGKRDDRKRQKTPRKRPGDNPMLEAESTAMSTEFTGMIPTPPKDDGELESYGKMK